MNADKMTWRVVAMVVGAAAAVACSSADVEDAHDDESEAELSAAGQRLAGAFGDNGNVRGLVLKPDGRFFLDLSSTIRCARAPCPSNAERVDGTFTAGAKTVTFRASGPAPSSARAQGYLGRFRYTKTASSLSLSKGADHFELDSKHSYCSDAVDCYGQAILVPACFPLQFSCTDQSTCSFDCGSAPIGPCRGLDEDACGAQPTQCRPKFGPSSCSPPPNARCTRDLVYKSCEPR